MARSEKSAGDSNVSDSAVQTGIEASSLAFGSEGDRVFPCHARPTDLSVRQAAILTDQIASLADRLVDLCNTIVDEYRPEAGDEPQVGDPRHVHLAQTASFLAAQVGWLADLGTQKLGRGEGLHGAAENWLCPPIYHAITRAAKGGDHD